MRVIFIIIKIINFLIKNTILNINVLNFFFIFSTLNIIQFS